MWEGGSRTPALVHGPGLGLPRGEVSSLWLHVTDWFPTILSMAGLTLSQTDLDGIDNWAQLQASYYSCHTKHQVGDCNDTNQRIFNLQ